MRRAAEWVTEHSLTIGLTLLLAAIASLFGHEVAGCLNHVVSKFGGAR